MVVVTDVSTGLSGGHPQNQVKNIRQVRLFMCLVFFSGYVIGRLCVVSVFFVNNMLCLVSVFLSITCYAWLVYFCQ